MSDLLLDDADRPPAGDAGALTASDLKHLLRAAERIDEEAQIWRDGCAVKTEQGWVWDSDSADIEVRVIKLDNSARFLRQIHAKMIKRLKQPNLKPETAQS